MKRRKQGKKIMKKMVGKRAENWEEEIEEHEDRIGPYVFLNKNLNGGKHYRVINTIDKDLEDFFKHAKKVFKLQSTNKKVIYTLKVKFQKLVNDGVKEVDFHFNLEAQPIIVEEDIARIYKEALDFFLLRIPETEMQGSGWTLESIEFLDFKIVEYKPLRGRRGKKKDQHPLPKHMKNCRYFVNMRNDDNECLKWAITRFLDPLENGDQDRITKDLREQSKKLNWKNIDFPSGKKTWRNSKL